MQRCTYNVYSFQNLMSNNITYLTAEYSWAMEAAEIGSQHPTEKTKSSSCSSCHQQCDFKKDGAPLSAIERLKNKIFLYLIPSQKFHISKWTSTTKLQSFKRMILKLNMITYSQESLNINKDVKKWVKKSIPTGFTCYQYMKNNINLI